MEHVDAIKELRAEIERLNAIVKEDRKLFTHLIVNHENRVVMDLRITTGNLAHNMMGSACNERQAARNIREHMERHHNQIPDLPLSTPLFKEIDDAEWKIIER